MKKLTMILTMIVAAVMLVGCAGLTPQKKQPAMTGGIIIINEANSLPTIASGNTNTQVIPINKELKIGAGEETGGDEAADAQINGKKARGSGVFVNVGAGDRSADIDAAAAIKLLNDVRGTTAAQSQATTKGDESPGSVGDQQQQAEQKEDKTTTVNIPVSAGQAARSDTGGEEAAPATEQNN